MKRIYTVKMLSAAASALLALSAVPAQAASNPFDITSPAGYRLAAADTSGKCGGGMGMSGQKGCGLMRMDTNGDGKVSKEEFMKGHAAMFDQMDTNGDGMVDMAEHRAHKATMREGMPGKCGQQKSAE